MRQTRGRVLVTGVGRRRGIGAGVAVGLARDGWDVVLSCWRPYDERLGMEGSPGDPESVAAECRSLGVRADVVQADLADAGEVHRLVDVVVAGGPFDGLVLAHCEGVDSDVMTTSVESWDRHFAVNARASWLLIRALAERLPSAVTTEARARVVALTSDHTAHNLPYGASKGALDRLTCAAAVELGPRGLRANVVNPGPVDTGWMDDAVRRAVREQTPVGRIGTPQDTADLVRFLFSDAGSWVTGQVLMSNGGFRTGA